MACHDGASQLTEGFSIFETRQLFADSRHFGGVNCRDGVAVTLWDLCYYLSPRVDDERMPVGRAVCTVLSMLSRRDDVALIFNGTCAQ